MVKLLKAIAVAAMVSLLAVAFYPAVAFAQSEVSSALVPVVCDETSHVCSVATGDIVGWFVTHLKDAVESVVLLVFAVLLRKIPSQIADVLQQFRVDSLLIKAIEYGISMVVGATKNQKWDVNVGSQVVAWAVNYAVRLMPDWLLNWTGGIDNLIQMAVSRIQEYLDPSVDGKQLVAAAKAALPVLAAKSGTPAMALLQS